MPLNYANTFIDKFNEVVSYKANELINNRRNEIEILQASTTITPGGNGKVIFYKVKRGQTIGSIAANNGVSVTKLKKWNHIHGSSLRTGQRLKIIK